MSRIFLVDDHTLVLDGLRAMIESGGHDVVGVAGDPVAATARVLDLDPDVLLLDIDLGNGRSGLEVLAALKPRKARVRALVLTMSGQARDLAEAMRLGAAGYLLKNCSRAELLKAIDTVAAGHRHLGPDLADLAVSALHPGFDPLAHLSMRERQVIGMVARGRTSSEIGQLLGLSPKTVDTYRSRLMAKLELPDIPSLVRFAIRVGLIDIGES